MSKQLEQIKQANNFLLKSEQKMLITLMKVESTCMRVIQIHGVTSSDKDKKSPKVQLAEEILTDIQMGWESNDHTNY